MQVILFGAGSKLQRLLSEGDFDKYEVLAIADNNKGKWGGTVKVKEKDVKIIHPREIMKYNFKLIILTVGDKELRLSIANQLIELGVDGEKIKYIYSHALVQQSWLNKEIYKGNENEVNFYMDITNIADTDTQTGIPRTVNSLYKNIELLGEEIIPIQWVGKYITGNVYKTRISLRNYDGEESIISFNKGDYVFFPDTSWIQGSKVFSDLKKGAVNIAVVVYDLMPILEKGIWNDSNTSIFKEWVDGALLMADSVVCISRTVADDVVSYFKQSNIKRTIPLNLFCFHLGFDIPFVETHIRQTIMDFVRRGRTFLTVGVLGPQKNHLLALQALRKYYQENPTGDIQLLIIGRDAFDNVPFKELYYSTERLGGKVLWVDDADDGELKWAYENCCALLFPTRNEGFGLPMVEAAHFGLPILCSDIPIFREIADTNADYFKVNDVDALKNALVDWNKSKKHADSSAIKIYSWQDSAREIISIFDGKKKPYAVLS